MTGQERDGGRGSFGHSVVNTTLRAAHSGTHRALTLQAALSQDSSPLPPPTQDTDVGSGHGKDNAISTVSKVPPRAEAREGVSEVGWGVQHFTE